jgi:spore coat polysaccharide biosynthesis predicted glycosyltransferase SpsG
MPIIFNNSSNLIAQQIAKISLEYPIIDTDNRVSVSIDEIKPGLDFLIIDNLKINKDNIFKIKNEYHIKNIMFRNYFTNHLFQFHMYIDINNLKTTFQNWDELLELATENIMEKVCFASR